jgi:alanine dehydrogenase
MEVKQAERRVGLTPTSVREVVGHGHRVVVERSAGAGIGAADDVYVAAGAEVVGTAAEVFERSDMVVKVKEPQAAERAMLRHGQILFTYLHLAPDPEQTADLVSGGATCIAYETVVGSDGKLPLLAPMSQVAGRMSIQAGAHSLESAQGGSGMLLGGVPGVPPATVVVLGGGVVGENATQMAVGIGADVVVLDRNTAVLEHLDHRFGATIRTVYSTRGAVEEWVRAADLVVGAVLVRGDRAPRLVSAEMLGEMRPGSVLVDVAIDQGGCFETSRPTTHAEPTYVIDGVVHYCVANMPGAVPKTSTYALNNATLPYVLALADSGLDALAADPGFLSGLNVHDGTVTEPHVAHSLGYEYMEPAAALAGQVHPGAVTSLGRPTTG